MLRANLVFFALAATAACGASSQESAEHQAALSETEASTQAWIAAYEESDAASLANLYEPDGMYAANTGEVLRGRDEILDAVRAWMARRPAGVSLDLELEMLRFIFSGNSAHTVSRFMIRAMPAGCTIDAGHALVVWRPQTDGTWLITSHLVNRDPEPPTDACPR